MISKKKLPLAVLSLSTLCILVSCGQKIEHTSSMYLKAYSADLNHDGKISKFFNYWNAHSLTKVNSKEDMTDHSKFYYTESNETITYYHYDGEGEDPCFKKLDTKDKVTNLSEPCGGEYTDGDYVPWLDRDQTDETKGTGEFILLERIDATNPQQEENLTWAESYDVLLNQTTDKVSLHRIAKQMNIDDNDPYRLELARSEIMHQAEDMLLESGIPVPIYNYSNAFLLKEDIKGSKGKSNERGVYASMLGNKFFEDCNKDNMNICVGSKSNTMDPPKNNTVETAVLLCQIYEGLMRYVPNGTDAEPFGAKLDLGCASEVDVDNENLCVDITIRGGDDGAKWQDGTPITAEDFIFSWNRAACPSVGKSCTMFDCIEGFDIWKDTGQVQITETEDCSKFFGVYPPGGTPGKWTSGLQGLHIEITDTNEKIHRKFRVYLKTPCAYFNELLAYPAFFPVNYKHMTKVEGGKRKVDSTWWNIKDPNSSPKEGDIYQCSNGVYKFQECSNRENGYFKLTPNDYYSNKNINVTTRNLTFRLLADDSTMLNKYDNNDLDYIYNISSGSIDDVKRKHKDDNEFCTTNEVATYYYLNNVNDNTYDMGWNLSEPLDEEKRSKLRRILALLINRNDLCTNVGKIGQTPSSGFVAEGVMDFVPQRDDEDSPWKTKVDEEAKAITVDWQTRNSCQKTKEDGKLGPKYNRFSDRQVEYDHEFDPSETENINEPIINNCYFATYNGKDAKGKIVDINNCDDVTKDYYNKRSEKVMKANIDKAVKLARECGITVNYNGDPDNCKFLNFPEIRLTMNTGSGHEMIAERIQYHLSLFNIKFSISTQEWNSFCHAKQIGDFALARNGWTADYTDPRTFLEIGKSIDPNCDFQFGRDEHHYSK